MKTVIFAALASAAIADDCTLSGSFEKLDATCTIPSSTDISPACCSLIQGNIDKDLAHEQPPSRQEKQELRQKCKSFQAYVEQHAPRHARRMTSPDEYIDRMTKALPDGLTCTEKIKGAGETACELHAKQGELAVTCKIPKETTITSECCSIIQGGIDKTLQSDMQPPSPQEKQELKQKCRSYLAYGMQHKPELGNGMFPSPKLIIDSLPAGLSCTETISGGDMLSVYANRTVISAISLAAGVGNKDVSDKASVMPSVVSGIAGFLAGGMLVAGAFLRYSKKQHGDQYSLLTGPEVA